MATRALAALPGFDGPNPQYFSVASLEDGTVLGQIISVAPADSIEVTKVGRVGSSTKKALRKSRETTVEFSMYIDNADLDEFARLLGATATPSAGDRVFLDPSVTAQTFKISNYDGEALASNLLSVIYLFNFTPNSLGFEIASDGEPVATIGGDLEDLYWRP